MSPTPAPVICWFRHDLRLDDNPALIAAAERGRPVLALFCLDEASPGLRPLGGASRWWLHHSLAALGDALGRHGVPLILRHGPATETIPALVQETGADTVTWNRLYEPAAIARDKRLKQELQDRGIAAESHRGGVLYEPWTVETKAGKPYSVFTPYWKALQAKGPPSPPLDPPERICGLEAPPPSDSLSDWTLLPTRPDWAGGIRAAWTPGEAAARRAFTDFADDAIADYANGRDRPGAPGCSRLSPYFHFGELSPRRIWHGLAAAAERGDASGEAVWAYLRELGWRDFNHHLLFHNPSLPEAEFNPQFGAFPWADDTTETEDAFAAWSGGRTGYPIVDAGMRELWQTGWMHNRVRMVTASFLVKHLLIDWRRGESWFWDTLVDADLANNVANWQWVAGCGADAAPYFRIFNPILQGEKFDPDGAYVRHWVPELSGLPDRWLHKPWEAPDDALAAAGVTLSETYPAPIVAHKQARERALARYKSLRDETD